MDGTVLAGSSVLHRSLKEEPLFVDRAEGSYVYLEDGRKILDGSGGAAVASIGHGNQRVIRAVAEQLGTVGYINSFLFRHTAGEELASKLTSYKTEKGLKPFERAAFVTGGSEAMEAAIKLARQYHLERGDKDRVNIIAREMSYHGNTLGALGICRHKARRAPFLPFFPPTFHAVSPCYAYRYKSEGKTDAEYVQELADELESKLLELGPGTVAAFFAETVVGATTACVPPVPGYLAAMQAICARYGVLFCLDEIMCGMGRSGKMHCWEWDDLPHGPDIQAVGKGISGGYAPLAAVLVSPKVVKGLQEGSAAFNNGHTYQSFAGGCRAAHEVLTIMEEDGLVEQCRSRGELLESLLKEQLADVPWVGDIRGRGLFWGVELVKDKATKECFPATQPVANDILLDLMNRGAVFYPGKGTYDGVQGDHIILAPPYTVTEDEVRFLVGALKLSLQAVLGGNA